MQCVSVVVLKMRTVYSNDKTLGGRFLSVTHGRGVQTTASSPWIL